MYKHFFAINIWVKVRVKKNRILRCLNCHQPIKIGRITWWDTYVEYISKFGGPAHTFTAKACRVAHLQLFHVPTYLSNKNQWFWFWSLALTYVPRDVICRFIVGKTPNQKLLHGFSKPIVTSPLCLLCSNHIVDT